MKDNLLETALRVGKLSRGTRIPVLYFEADYDIR